MTIPRVTSRRVGAIGISWDLLEISSMEIRFALINFTPRDRRRYTSSISLVVLSAMSKEISAAVTTRRPLVLLRWYFPLKTEKAVGVMELSEDLGGARQTYAKVGGSGKIAGK